MALVMQNDHTIYGRYTNAKAVTTLDVTIILYSHPVCSTVVHDTHTQLVEYLKQVTIEVKRTKIYKKKTFFTVTLK
jgi:hypothetical protein